MRSIVWWTVWGLVMSVGAIGLLEFHRSHYFLILSLPLLTGALAAAVRRLEHEYKHALEHAKWAGVSAAFLLAAVGFLYVKAHAYGPFSTATPHKALLGTRFGMSVPEVERTIGRKLREHPVEGAIHDRAHEWLMEALPLALKRSDEAYSLLVTLFGSRSQITFHFDQRRLSRVELQFMPTTSGEIAELKKCVTEELGKDYVLKEESVREGYTRMLFEKDAVAANLVIGAASNKQVNLRVVLEYLPLAAQQQPPLAVETNVF